MCPICKRSNCARCFHTLEAQERFDLKEEMSDDVDILREKILSLQEEIEILRNSATEAGCY